MTKDFANWLESITMHDARRARKGMERSWKKTKHTPHAHRQFKKFEAGTFGIEIEFRVESESGDRHYTEEQKEAIKQELKDRLYDVIWKRQPSYTYSPDQLRDDWSEFSQDKYPQYESIHDWEHENEEPEKPDDEDYEDDDEGFQDALEIWDDEYKEWKEKRDEMEEEIDAFDHDKLQAEFIQEIIDEERWGDYDISDDDHYMSDFDNKAEEYQEVLEDLGWDAEIEGGGPDTWNIHRDGDGMCELTSSILTPRDIPALVELFNHAQDEVTDGSTSCHIHIGMPDDTDGFDLVAMTTLADESKLIRDLPDRDFSGFADFNSNLQWAIKNKLEPGVYTKDEFLSTLKNTDRTGTNISAFFRHGTVEFRYLSSDVLHKPKMILGWINYFLTLPKIARGRKQIKIGEGRYDVTYLTRVPNGGVKVDKAPEGKVKQEPGSPEDLRRSKKESPYEKKKAELRLGMVSRYVDKMRLDHFLMMYGGPRHQPILSGVKGALSMMGERDPKVKQLITTIFPNDPHFNDYSNVQEIGKHLTMGELFRYSTESNNYGWLRRYAVDAVNKDFDVTRKNVEGWKKQ
jgi:hypothetical protein